MQPRPFDPDHDLPAVAELISRTRAAGGLSHPGGIQWWLRDSGNKEDFEAFVWQDDGELTGFALVDDGFAVTERAENGPTDLEQVEWLEQHLRETGKKAIEFRFPEGDPIQPELAARGYSKNGVELELMADVAEEPVVPALPQGFRFASLNDVPDDVYVAGHVAAWSDTRPSRYSRQKHDIVKQAPTFRPDLVTIALAADGTVASYCIGWMDARSETLEIEPLGTHRDYRRLGLAHAVVKEVHHRAWANGAKRALVWNDPNTNPRAYGLYTGAGMASNRTLIQMRKAL